MVGTLYDHFDSSNAIIFDGKVQFIKPSELRFDMGGPGGYRRVHSGTRWVKADGARGKEIQEVYQKAVNKWNDALAEQQAHGDQAEYDKQRDLEQDASFRYDQEDTLVREKKLDLERIRGEQTDLNIKSDAIKAGRAEIHKLIDDKTLTIEEGAKQFEILDGRQATIDHLLTDLIQLEDSEIELIKGGEERLQLISDEIKAAQSRMDEAQPRPTEEQLALGDEVEQLPRDRVGDTLDAITRGAGRAVNSLGSMIGRGMIREGVTQTSGALATAALNQITGINVGGIVQQTIPVIGAALAGGGLSANSGVVIGGLLTIGLGAGAAGYAIGQLNQAQDDIDDQRETQIINREIWEAENGPLDEHIAAAGRQFVDDLESADSQYGDLEVTDEPDSGDEPDKDEDKSGKGDDSPDDDSPSGGGGGPPEDDKPASKAIAERKPEDHTLPKWFPLSFLDWLKNLLEGYKMLIMAAFFGGVLVKKLIFSPKRKKNDRLVA